MTTFDFDVIVVGSGFGGSVMTYRLAEAGLRVCLLERGKAWPPGSFPRSPWRMRTNFWDPSERLHGMFNIWSFADIGGVVSSGLGGGSLIYANVLYRKPAETFAPEGWPISYDDLAPHYHAAESMLNGQSYPFQVDAATRTAEHQLYNVTSKTRAMHHAAQVLARDDPDVEFQLPKLAVTFSNPGSPPMVGEPIIGAPPSLHERGRTRLTCQLCGECDIRCNFGSKNTLDLTYLSAAMQLEQQPSICTNAEVRTFEPHNGGYRVHYVDHAAAANGEPDAPKSSDLKTQPLTSRFLVLSAGSLGSTYLMLKNIDSFSHVNRHVLGTKFCGNGDLLTVLVRSKEEQKKRGRPRVLDSSYGLVITSAIRFKDVEDGALRGYYYIEDAGYPDFANWLIESANPLPLFKRAVGFGRIWLSRRLGFSDDSDISEEISRLLGDCRLSSTSMPLLGMGRDTADGTMALTKKGRLAVKWNMLSSASYFGKVRKSARSVANALHADFAENPLTYLSRVITVHPLGGCPMGRTSDEGVVDTHGEVFGHPRFYIADGSVIPGAIGPNPSLTIAACADRFADHLITKAKADGLID
ncbi:GMC oxidoreductase [soil metagenome]